MKNFKILLTAVFFISFAQVSFAQVDRKDKPSREIETDGNKECVEKMAQVNRALKKHISSSPKSYQSEESQADLKNKLIQKFDAADCYGKGGQSTDDGDSDEENEDFKECAEKMFKKYISNKKIGSEDIMEGMRKEFYQDYADKIKENCN